MIAISKIAVLYLTIQLSNIVLCHEFVKTVSITKEFHHAHHLLHPFSIIKEKITPFGKFSYKHTIAKRDLENGPSEESGQSETLVETKEKVSQSSNQHSDVLVTHIKYQNGKPIETLKLHSIVLPWSSENQNEEIIVQPLVGITDILNGGLTSEKNSKIISETSSTNSEVIETTPEKRDAEPKAEVAEVESLKDSVESVNVDKSLEKDKETLELSAAKEVHSEKSKEILESTETAKKSTENQKEDLKVPEATDNISGTIVKSEGEVSNTDGKDELKIDGSKTTETVELTAGALKSNEGIVEKEKLQIELTKIADVKENKKDEVSSKASESADLVAAESNAIDKNVEIVETSPPPKQEALEVTPVSEQPIPEKTVEVTSKPIERFVPVSPLPAPAYIPLYTDIRTPVPIPVESIAQEVPPVAPEVVPAVDTGIEVIVPPPPAPPVNTATTVIETQQSPNLFSRGSRFLLNVSSVILKKLMRLVTSARSNLNDLSLSRLTD
ncbi:putative ankyrin repeat protein RF_0987 [Leptidea sinapis]|uniref:putative ankyrin repeat protein RF_0987 n=1 Tax=Leptidea sinapis TaxID=189913 RepID=UPI0021C39DE5|nr:putative ankyrin repeat protein RF_0987 [Leptidea sinapis]